MGTLPPTPAGSHFPSLSSPPPSADSPGGVSSRVSGCSWQPRFWASLCRACGTSWDWMWQQSRFVQPGEVQSSHSITAWLASHSDSAEAEREGSTALDSRSLTCPSSAPTSCMMPSLP